MFIFPFDSARITPLGSYAECVPSRIMASKRALRNVNEAHGAPVEGTSWRSTASENVVTSRRPPHGGPWSVIVAQVCNAR
jgi:hypothetical protein